MPGTIAWISVTPVKGLRLQQRDEVQLTEDGVPGDRAFFLVDERGAMVSATRLGRARGRPAVVPPWVAVKSGYGPTSGGSWP
jgi:uncharacterized protein YcbX